MPERDFIFWSDGRLGNQLFQYAFCHAMARRRRCRFLFVARHPQVRDSFRLGSRFEMGMVSGAMAGLLRRLRPVLGSTVEIDSWTPPGDGMAKCLEPRSLSGFFHGEDYFSDCIPEIRRLFTLKPMFEDSFPALRRRLGIPDDGSGLVAIHVRRGDYLAWGSAELGGTDLSLSAEWYRQAVAAVAGECVTQAVIVTDDPEWCRRNLELPWPSVISEGTPELDLRMLMHARVRIVSNSSFAWWGGWLNELPGRVVVAPRYWLGFKVARQYPPGVIPHTWLQI